MSEALSPKQIRFCKEYIVDYNATRAAIKAGFSKKSARSKASQLLTKVNIQKYIESLQQPIVDDLKISAERVLREIADLAFEKKSKESRHSKTAGLKMLGEHLKLFTQMHESTMTFKNMGKVKMKTKDGEVKEVLFNVGKPIVKKDK